MAESDPPLPRLPEDLDNLRRLRREALRRMAEDEDRMPVVIYGGPPPQPDRPTAAAVYGGPTMGDKGVTRRWTLKRILVILAAMLAGLMALFFGTRKNTNPVYGGPPVQPRPGPVAEPVGKENAPVYGGPPMYDREPRTDKDQSPNQDPYLRDQRPTRQPDRPIDPADPDPSLPATVYGGPPLDPQERPQ